MRWLILGGAGQLGRDLQDVLSDQNPTALDLPDIDITDQESIAAAFDAHTPDVVVNAAAYTAVDAAEDDEQAATLVNGTGPGLLAAACASRPAVRLVQLSTDYVFAGDATVPYPEAASPDPRSAYGRSKLLGEQLVRSELPDRSFIVRTAWLYGQHGVNFVKTMLRLAAAWFRFTREIFRLAAADPERVRPTTTDSFPRPAPRPAFSVLGHDAWTQVGLPEMRTWDEALSEALPRLIQGSG